MSSADITSSARGCGFHAILAYRDEAPESWRACCVRAMPGANSAADQIAIAEAALRQIAREHMETIKVLLRVDSAGACPSCSTGRTTRIFAVVSG